MTWHLSAPVLRHKVFKPSYSCISAIRGYFASLPKPIKDHELIVVGDRIFTDVVLANRMSRRQASSSSSQSAEKEEKSDESSSSSSSLLEDGNSPKWHATRTGPLSVWTTGVWRKESMTMRFLEKSFMQGIQHYVVADNGLGHHAAYVSQFVKEIPPPPPPEPETLGKRLLGKVWSVLSKSR